MLIGELADRTGTSRRLLRYYEEQGLLSSSRSPNGYRAYAESCVDRVLQVRGLLDAGLPTRVIKEILPCMDSPRATRISGATDDTIATLERERDRMTDRIRCLERNRDAIAGYLDAVREARGTARPLASTPAEAPALA
ncbi:MerR family transcriptional regulator [Luteimicrobium sp. NPDC057192]|uniref:MerR family transcriptional regulator n=1 Tax=Luteimicrobium sp. NPDC057192 TaxID=3346042 RepID=UPI003633C870